MTTPPPEARLPRGRRLALDVGTVRIGVALSDPDGILATPHGVVPRRQGADVRDVARLVEHESVAVVYVGLPRTLAGRDSASTTLARTVAQEIADLGVVEVRLVDERLSTVDASRRMQASGRSARRQRADIDAAAAVVILQGALDAERGAGERAGTLVGAAQWSARPAPVHPRPVPSPPPRRRGVIPDTSPAATPQEGPS